MKKENFFLVLGILILLSVFYLGTAKNNTNQNFSTETAKLRVAYPDPVTDFKMPLEIAEQKGIFKKNNLEVEKKPSPAVSLELLEKEADVIIQLPAQPYTAYKGGQDFVLLAGLSNYTTSYGVSRLPKDKLAEIKNIGVRKIGISEQVKLQTALKGLGVSDSLIEKTKLVVSADDTARLAMLEKKEIDFTSLSSQKALEVARQKGYTIFSPEEISKEVLFPKTLISSKKNLENNKDAIQRFLYAILEANEYVKSNPNEVKDYLISSYKFSDSQAETFYQDFVKSIADLRFALKKEDLKKLFEASDKLDNVKAKREIDGLFNTELAETALKKIYK